MSSEPSLPADRPAEEVRPQQFGLLGLVALLTVAAALFAFAAPTFKHLPWGHQFAFVASILGQIGAMAVGKWVGGRERAKLQQSFGRCLGIGHPRDTWDVTARGIQVSLIVMAAIVEVGVAVVIFIAACSLDTFWLIIPQLSVGFLAGLIIHLLLHLREVGMIRFCENGIACGSRLWKWDHVYIADNPVPADAIDIMTFPERKSDQGIFRNVHVAPGLKTYLLANHDAAHRIEPDPIGEYIMERQRRDVHIYE